MYWCRALVRISEERMETLRLEITETDSENLNGQYMALVLLVFRLREVLAEAETAAHVYAPGANMLKGGDA